MIHHVPLSKIKTNKAAEFHLRLGAEVEDLMESILEIGLINPLVVTETMELVCGGRRYTALKRLQAEGKLNCDVAVICYDMDAIDTEIMSIDDNIRRRQFEGAKLAAMLVRRKELWEMKHPETKHGVAGVMATNKVLGRGKDANAKLASASETEEEEFEEPVFYDSEGYEEEEPESLPVKTFSKEVSENTGMSQRKVQREIQRYKEASEKVKESWEKYEIGPAQVDELVKAPKEIQDGIIHIVPGKTAAEIAQIVKDAKEIGIAQAIEAAHNVGEAERLFKEISTKAKALNVAILKALNNGYVYEGYTKMELQGHMGILKTNIAKLFGRAE